MQVTVRREHLLRELVLARGINHSDSSIPVLAYVLLEAKGGGGLRISATDLEVSLRCGCPAAVEAEGAMVLPGKMLRAVVRSLPEDAEISLKELPDLWASIDCGSVHFKLPGLPRDDHPLMPSAAAGAGIKIPGEVLRELIARTVFAITTEDARYYLAGALMVLEKDGVAMVATDGHRLAYVRRTTPLEVDKRTDVLIPRMAIAQLAGLLAEELGSVTFRQGGGYLFFEVGDRQLSSKAIEGNFPQYEKVIDGAGDKVATFDRERMASSIKRVALLSSAHSRAVKLGLDRGRLRLEASTPDNGEAVESIDASYEGPAVEVGFNASYLVDFLAVAGEQAVSIALSNGESQGLFRPHAPAPGLDYRYVVMPMRL